MKIGFVINPLAGIGGSVALKGSDGRDIVAQAISRGARPQAEARATVAMQKITATDNISIITASGAMGESVLLSLNLPCEVIYKAEESSSAQDTRNAVALFIQNKVELIIFAGGDGTARDVMDGLEKNAAASVPVIGIPAGVKIHSAVYAVTPARAGELINLLFEGVPMSLQEAQVMDLDEDAFRNGVVNAKCYGYMQVPVDDTRMQLIKQGGLNYHDIAVQDIAADVIEAMQQDVYYLIGSGSTTAEIMDQLGLQNTLLGVDIVYNRELVASDVSEQEILGTIKDHPVKIVVSIIGGQGHVFGRGNQQLGAEVISRVINQHAGRDNIIITATNEKLRSLDKRPMLSDTGNTALDKQLAGLYSVVTGYQQRTLYKLT